MVSAPSPQPPAQNVQAVVLWSWRHCILSKKSGTRAPTTLTVNPAGLIARRHYAFLHLCELNTLGIIESGPSTNVGCQDFHKQIESMARLRPQIFWRTTTCEHTSWS
jgi:hypothetical protein